MDHDPQEIQSPGRPEISICREGLAWIACTSALLATFCGCGSQSAARASSTDVAPMINSQIQSLPPQGGTVDFRSLIGMQFIDSTIVVDHPVTLLLGAATFNCGASILGPCIRVTRPSHIEMMRASTPSDHGFPVPEFGTRITAAPGFAGFLISVEGAQSWNTAFGTTIEGGVLDGSAHSASGVHIQNQFGVHLRDLNIVNVNYGVQLENTNGLWTEGSWLDNVWIFDPATAGIDMKVSPGGTTSVANAYWNRVFINLFTSGSVGLQTDSAALFANSRVSFLKIWMSSGKDGAACKGVAPVTLTGIHVRADMVNTVFANMNVEALSCAGSNLAAVISDPGVKPPVFEHFSVQGNPLPTVQ
jgi:hypothetical protein